MQAKARPDRAQAAKQLVPADVVPAVRPLGLELSLSGTKQSLSDSQTCTNSSGLLPVIKGQTAASGMINFDCVEVTGQLFQERFGYSQRFLDSHLDAGLPTARGPAGLMGAKYLSSGLIAQPAPGGKRVPERGWITALAPSLSSPRR